MKEIKKFCVKFIIFLLGIFSIFYILGRFDDLVIRNNVDSIFKIREAGKYDSLDYLILGNSYAYSDVSCDPFDSLGLKYYNLGIQAASSHYYEMVLNDYLGQVKVAPKNILIMVSPIMFADVSDDWENYTIHSNFIKPLSNFDIFLKYEIGFRRFLMLSIKSAKTGLENLFYFSTNKTFEPSPDFISTRGFIRRNGVLEPKDTLNPEDLWLNMNESKFNTEKYNYLLDIVKKLKEKNINIIFYEPPVFITQKYFSEQFMKSYFFSMKQLENMNFKIIYKNEYNNNLSITDYCNLDHMNNKGADKYTRYLLKTLLQPSNKYH
jgi:hypothetical protein